MATRRFWNGFAAGAAAGVGAATSAVLVSQLVGRVRNRRVLRLEKSLQVGRPVDEVFRAWSNLEELPRFVNFIERVERRGSRTHWVVNLAGKRLEWDAEITQNIPNQALGWKSVNGPKHTGRIDFSPIGEQTLVHVTMNYSPPLQWARLFSPLSNPIERYIEEAFRGFKAALENDARERGGPRALNTSPTMQRQMAPTPSQAGSDVIGTPAFGEQRATGTHGATDSELHRHTQASRYGGSETVDHTRPPEAKS